MSAEQTVSLRALQQSFSVSRQGNCLGYFYLFLCPVQGLENQELPLLSESCKTLVTGCQFTNKTSPRCWKSSSWSSSQSRRSRWTSPSHSASCWRQAGQQPPPWCGVSQVWGETSHPSTEETLRGETCSCYSPSLFSEKTIIIFSELSPTVTRGIPPLNIADSHSYCSATAWLSSLFSRNRSDLTDCECWRCYAPLSRLRY